jgi:hypothetical protein
VKRIKCPVFSFLKRKEMHDFGDRVAGLADLSKGDLHHSFDRPRFDFSQKHISAS